MPANTNSDLLSRSLSAVWHPCTQIKRHETLPLVPIARGEGVWISKAGATPEPLVDGEAEFGMQVLLLRQRPCLPDDCPEDLIDFDLGYLALVARAQTELDRDVDEVMIAAGAALHYRPQFGWSASSIGFLIPTISLGIGAAWPVTSALRDSLRLDNASCPMRPQPQSSTATRKQ